MSEARRHHYIPQCYLKNFAVRQKKSYQIHVYDAIKRSIYATSIKNIAVEQDFNRIDVAGMAIDSHEAELADFESALGPALERTNSRKDLKIGDDRELILNFMSLLAVKNPRFREIMREFQERVSKKIMNIALATPERWRDELEKLREKGIEVNDDVSYDDMVEFITNSDYSVNMSTTSHAHMEMSSHDSVLKTFADRGWMVARAGVTSGGFITSDHPVCLISSDERSRGIGLGYGVKGTEVLFPLSQEIALVGAFDAPDNAVNVSNEWVSRFNGIVASCAERSVFARNRNFKFLSKYGLERKASKLLDDPKFLRPRHQLKGRLV